MLGRNWALSLVLVRRALYDETRCCTYALGIESYVVRKEGSGSGLYKFQGKGSRIRIRMQYHTSSYER